MAEYLSPGVYVEETSFRSKSIEGVSTTTTGFIGPSRYGPIDLVPDIITSLGEFERTYGDGQKMEFSDGSRDNFLWHAARAFFAEGGKRLYISRTFRRRAARDVDGVQHWEDQGPDEDATVPTANYADGYARGLVSGGSPVDDELLVRARYPGSGGNFHVHLTLRAGQSVLSGAGANAKVRGLNHRDVVLLFLRDVPVGSSPAGSARNPFYVAERADDGTWSFSAPGGESVELTSLTADDAVHPVTVTVTARRSSGEEVWDNLALDPSHVRDGLEDSLTRYFRFDSADPQPKRALPIVIDAGADLTDGVAVAEALVASNNKLVEELADVTTRDEWLKAFARFASLDVTLKGGNDGATPSLEEYAGAENVSTARKRGLVQFEDLDDISIVAAPGSTYNNTTLGLAVAGLLIAHAESMRYRIAVLDSENGDAIGDVRQYRAKLDSKYAALYYPWVRVLDPITRAQISLPPSGFVTGIYARNDIERAVYKAPANEVVRLALGFEITLNKSQQDVLNPEGVNCFRFFEGRGNRLWGARTISSDPEWKYVNLRRYFAYLEHSIDKGTQWAVFEPNGERLWANVRRTIEDFLFNEYQNGALLGDRPERAYFVKCDRSTMTQNDLDNGRLVCLIGVAPLRPAEFVIFRIGQWTGDRKV